ncbi:glycosyltransferase family 2 protein [Kaistella pullorum]|uniref:Glycosyltransferase n=1 Tax=Kaistella pullorum TaxID=2763074 RepID=A0ABR8WJK5_9FLAO|nr:glycosyltransferase [Kaistella pullorum]MBD8017163.1 glycosyltransferase [Kaistella pullorum]
MVKVSVIVPVYNVEKYLKKCLGSLVNQTLREIEIIVVDDGSRDSSPIIIVEFENEHPQLIKHLKKQNGGLSDARNFGLDHAAGEFIGFVDADDEVSPKMFAELYALCQKHDAQIALCNLVKVDEYGNELQKLPQIPNLPEKVVLHEDLTAFADLSYFACNKLFKKELFKDKRFKKDVHFEDIQLIPQLLLDSTVIAHSPEYYYRYLERNDSISRTHTSKGLDILRAVEDVEKYFSSSRYRRQQKELRRFQILEGVYTFLAYWAFVKDAETSAKMAAELKKFTQNRGLGIIEILRYQRFGQNYLLSLPVGKQIFYLLYFAGFRRLPQRLAKNTN